MAGLPSKDAFTQSVIKGAAPEDTEALLMLATTSLDGQHASIDALARGEALPVAPAPAEAPAPSAAGAVFSAEASD
jgi:hypothetical protein